MNKIVLINGITTIRVIGVLLLYPIYVHCGAIPVAAACLICYITDFFDGLLARKLNATTFFGSIYDTFADKLLNITCLLILYNITNYALIIIVFELLIILVNLLRMFSGQNIKTKQTGRVKMFVLAFTILATFILSEFTSINNLNIYIILFSIAILSEVSTFSSYLTHFILNKKTFAHSLDLTKLKGKWFDHKFYEQNKNKAIKKVIH